MKNLANCKPSEFLKQTNKIRKAVAKWLTATEIMEIRKHLPDVDENMSQEERREKTNVQMAKNAGAILDSIMDKHPDETLEILALLCFVEPENVDDHTVSEYLSSFNELIGDPAVMGFFTSLLKLDQMRI